MLVIKFVTLVYIIIGPRRGLITTICPESLQQYIIIIDIQNIPIVLPFPT